MFTRPVAALASLFVLLAAAMLGGCTRRPRARSPSRISALANCTGGTRGSDHSCGSDGHASCCDTRLVPGGTFLRSFDGVGCANASYPATVSDFGLDTYEVTVGRFRAFVRDRRGTRADPPSPGAGAHPRIAGSGWNPDWDDRLEPDPQTLSRRLQCRDRFATWTDAPGDHESQPINCLTWYEAFAFCAWDGGRLPTEAERNYAASGGSEQRVFPWSQPPRDARIDTEHAVYGALTAAPVGSRSSRGDGRYGHADLAGNVWEWTLDSVDGRRLLPTEGASFCDPAGYTVPCRDCARLVPDSARVLRGGGFGIPAPALIASLRRGSAPGDRFHVFGVRCARAVPAAVSPSATLPCVPRCEARACGADGCGGTCGSCSEGGVCDSDGQCVAPWPAGPQRITRGSILPNLALTGYRDERRESLSRFPIAQLRQSSGRIGVAPASAHDAAVPPSRALVLYLAAAWSRTSDDEELALSAASRRYRARGATFVALLVEGQRHGQGADATDLETWARSHAHGVAAAIDSSILLAGALPALPATVIVDLHTLRVLEQAPGLPSEAAPFWTALESLLSGR